MEDIQELMKLWLIAGANHDRFRDWSVLRDRRPHLFMISAVSLVRPFPVGDDRPGVAVLGFIVKLFDLLF